MSRGSAGLGPLTLRGALMTGSGISLIVVGVSTGLPSLVRAGVLVAALPLLAALALVLARPRAAVERTLEPQAVTAGSPSRVRLRVTVTSALPLRGLRAQDTRSPGLEGRSRFELASAAAAPARSRDAGTGAPGREASATTVTYRVNPSHRGEHRVGPLVMTLRDPLGLVRGATVSVRPRSSSSAGDPRRDGPSPGGAGARRADEAVLLALPRAVPLVARTGAVGDSGSSGSTTSSPRSGSERASGVREYLVGDDVRRINWRATARADQLMVSQDEEPLVQRAVLTLDTTGPWSRASFERAVVTAASVLVALGDGGREVELHTGGETFTGPAADLLRVLAVVEPDGPGSTDRATPEPRPASRAASAAAPARLVAVLSGQAPPLRAAPPASAPRGGSAPAVLLVDVPAGAAGGAPDGRTLDAALRAAGWRVARILADDALENALPGVWESLEGGSGADVGARVRAGSTA